MIKYLKHHEIDKQRWDDCINHSANGLIYALSWYLDVVCPDWEALIKDDYQYVFPLTPGKKYGIGYLYQPYFAQQLGVFSVHPIHAVITGMFISAIPKKYRLVEINLNESQGILTENPVWDTNDKKMRFIQNLNLKLSLDQSYEELLSRYSQNTKRNLKKAREAGASIVNTTPITEIIEMFRQHRGKDIEKMNDQAYAILQSLATECNRRGCLRILGAMADGKLCAGVVFVSWHQHHILLFSAVNTQARHNGAMSLLVDSFIKEHAESDGILDFEGSNDANLARFYRSFGSAENFYDSLRINHLPFIVKAGLFLLRKK